MCSKKICSNCNIEKELSEFNKRSFDSSGYNGKCRICVKKYMKEYHAPKRIGKYQDKWKPGFKICSTCKKELSYDNFHKSKLGYMELKTNCKICEQKRNNNYRRKDGWEAKYRKNRRQTDVQFYLKDILRGRLNDALRRHTSGGKVNKKHSALILLGCTLDELMISLESNFQEGMTWNNRGKVWEIDHIKPCDLFNLIDENEQKRCFHYSNLQPLTIHDNRSKNNKYKII